MLRPSWEGVRSVSLVCRPGLSAPAQSEPTVEGLGHRRGLPMMRQLIIAIVMVVVLPNAASRAESKKSFNRALTNQYTEQLNRKVLEQLQSSEMGNADQPNRRQLESVGPGVGPPIAQPVPLLPPGPYPPPVQPVPLPVPGPPSLVQPVPLFPSGPYPPVVEAVPLPPPGAYPAR